MTPDQSKIPPTKILVISDNAKDVLVLRMMSAESKTVRYEYLEAKTLKEAFAQIESEEPALAILDLALKGNKGESALLEFQKSCPLIPVVILIERENQAEAAEVVRQGAQDYLVKGKFDPNLLIHVIQYAIERHRVMNEMRRKNDELQRLNALKSEFVSTVSHELRTPLTVVLSAANNLLDGAFGSLSDDQRKWIQKINQHSLRLHEMISDILDLSKLQSGKSKLRRQEVDMGKLVKTVISNLQMVAKEKSLDLSSDVGPHLPILWGDASRLEQVATNLVTNAIKYTPAKGFVRVSVRQAGEMMRVCVEDNGIGVAPEHQEMIFDRFRQVRGQGKNESSTQGIGLGLAICREIVDQHKGRIWVESEPGKGSRFQFDVPLDLRGPVKRVVNILVVDDDPEISQLIEMTLAQAGCSVVLSRNGKHAIQILEDGNTVFDFAFLDLMLPGASGVEVIKKIRKLKLRTEIVVVTAYPNSEMLFEGLATGPLTVIGKPFNAERILDIALKRKAA